MSDAIATRTRTTQPAHPQGRQLRVVPLLGPSDDQPPYAVLDDAALRSVQITETSESGSVPNLKVANGLDIHLFLMDGQELVGAKQNRILNTDVLVPAKQKLIIPVSCVEQGRWRHVSPSFTSGKSASHRVRSSKLQRVHDSLRQSKRHDAGQHEVWEDVASSLQFSGAASPTRALADAYSHRQLELADLRATLTVPPNAVGLAVFHDGRLQGVDLFDRHTTLRHFWNALIDSYAIDFLTADATAPAKGDAAETDAVEAILARAAVGTWESFDPPGDGQDWRLVDTSLAGSALVWNDRTVIHLQLFPRQSSRGPRIHRRRN